MNKPTSFPPLPAPVLGSEHAALKVANASGDHSSAPTTATEPTSRAKIGREKIVPPPLAMRYSHF